MKMKMKMIPILTGMVTPAGTDELCGWRIATAPFHVRLPGDLDPKTMREYREIRSDVSPRLVLRARRP